MVQPALQDEPRRSGGVLGPKFGPKSAENLKNQNTGPRDPETLGPRDPDPQGGSGAHGAPSAAAMPRRRPTGWLSPRPRWLNRSPIGPLGPYRSPIVFNLAPYWPLLAPWLAPYWPLLAPLGVRYFICSLFLADFPRPRWLNRGPIGPIFPYCSPVAGPARCLSSHQTKEQKKQIVYLCFLFWVMSRPNLAPRPVPRGQARKMVQIAP